jgi:hypothetical protein
MPLNPLEPVDYDPCMDDDDLAFEMRYAEEQLSSEELEEILQEI